jgi:hypothetical protein
VIITPGSTSQSITIQIVDDSGLAVVSLVAATFPTTYYERVAEALQAISLSDLSLLTSGYSSGGVKEVGSGYYRLDVPDAAFATSSRVRIIGEATGKHILYPVITCAKLASTLGSTDYSGNTVQTGDAFARIGAAGVNLTNVGDTAGTTTLLGRVDATISSRSTLTASQAATAVWQDTTSGDFTVAGSIGKSLFTSGAVPGAAGGLFIAGTNAATTVTSSFTTTFTGNLTGSVASVTAGVSLAASQHVIVDSGTVTTLSNLPTAPTDWLTAAAVKADAVTKIQSGLSTYAGGDTSGTTTLLSRLSNTRAGYLDNLNVGGAVASQGDVQSVNQSASKHLLIQTVGQFERPESGNTTYTVEVRTFNASTGAAVNADSTPTMTATGQTSGDLSANLGTVTNITTGVYRATYTVSSSATIEPLRFDVSATISSSTFTLSTYSQVADVVSATWTSTEQAKLDAIYNKLPSGSLLDAAASRSAQGLGAANLDTQLNAIYTVAGLVQAKTDNLPASPAAVGSAMTLADGAITEAKITMPAEAAGRPTGFLASCRRAWEWVTNRTTRDRTSGNQVLYGADNTTVLETRTQSTSGTSPVVDEITKGS